MARLAFLLACIVALTAVAASVPLPALTGRVVDAAGILSPGTEAALNSQLEAHERATGQQIVVATVKDLGGLDLETYGNELGRQWQIGGKEHDTGVVLLIVPTLRKVRIEVGYGLEGDLTDAMSANIIQTRILPQFRNGDMDGGVRAGVNAIIAVLGGNGEALQPQPRDDRQRRGSSIPVGIFWLIVLIIVMSGGFGGRRGGGGGLARAIIWGSVLNGMGGRGRGGYGGGGFGGGGFGGGGGGFHGGGGSFGGGGASGSW